MGKASCQRNKHVTAEVDAASIALGLTRYVNTLATVPMAGERPQLLIVSPIEISPKYRDFPLFYDMFGENADLRSKKFAKEYEAFAKTMSLPFIDAALFAKADDIDGIHMNADSHANLGRALADKVREILV